LTTRGERPGTQLEVSNPTFSGPQAGELVTLLDGVRSPVILLGEFNSGGRDAASPVNCRGESQRLLPRSRLMHRSFSPLCAVAVIFAGRATNPATGEKHRFPSGALVKRIVGQPLP
jgi:hypothetical protein